MNILVTGAAGFIGFHLTHRILATTAHRVVAVDNINDYYSPQLKRDRLARLAALAAQVGGEERYVFHRLDIADTAAVAALFATEHFDTVVNLAGQAGVRHSIEAPMDYVAANLTGFANIVEGCRRSKVRHLLYASSSSVYGDQTAVPYRESADTDSPVSLYAATKKSDELMAHSYSHLYGLRTTALRFFTVYGPWGRPDMAPFLFLHNIIAGKPIRVFNHGRLSRDFTYIDDIITAIMLIVERQPATPLPTPPATIYNIGHGSPVSLMRFIAAIERAAKCRAVCEMLPMQPGDVHTTYADTTLLQRDYDFRPAVNIDEGIENFCRWYREYYVD